MRDFDILPKYKGFKLYKMSDGAITCADKYDLYLGCAFEDEQTAKYFIDSWNDFIDNIYTIISELKDIAINKNNGLVTKGMIDEFKF